MARSKNSRNKGYWFWAARNHWVHTTATGKRIAIVDDDGQKVEGQDNEKQAEANFWRMKLAGDLAEDESEQSDLQKIVKAYVDSQKGPRRKHVRRTLARFSNGFKTADEITPAYVQQWLNQFPSGATQQMYRKTLAAMFNHAKKPAVALLPLHYVNPASTKSGIVTADSVPHDYTFSTEEIETILKESHPAFAAFFKVCLLTGARPAEIAAINPEHLAEENGTLIATLKWHEWKVGKKTKKARTIVFPDADVSKEIKRLAANCKPGEAVFKTATGLRWAKTEEENKDGRWSSIVRNGRKAGWFPEGARLYSARHTTITRYVTETTYSFDQLAKLFGTSADMITKVYGHLRASDLIQMATAI